MGPRCVCVCVEQVGILLRHIITQQSGSSEQTSWLAGWLAEARRRMEKEEEEEEGWMAWIEMDASEGIGKR